MEDAGRCLSTTAAKPQADAAVDKAFLESCLPGRSSSKKYQSCQSHSGEGKTSLTTRLVVSRSGPVTHGLGYAIQATIRFMCSTRPFWRSAHIAVLRTCQRQGCTRSSAPDMPHPLATCIHHQLHLHLLGGRYLALVVPQLALSSGFCFSREERAA